MDPKLAIRVPQDVLDEARRYATRNNTTLAGMTAAYRRHLTREQDFPAGAPRAQRLAASRLGTSPSRTTATP